MDYVNLISILKFAEFLKVLAWLGNVYLSLQREMYHVLSLHRSGFDICIQKLRCIKGDFDIEMKKVCAAVLA